MAFSSRPIVNKTFKYVGVFLYSGCICNFVTTNILAAVRCQQKSMYPTINKTSKDDYLIAEMISKKSYKKNDVVVLKHPQFPEQLICKRITLVEGDKLPNNKIYNSHSSKLIRRGHVWVQGDNSNCSVDSRSFGPVPLGLVMGRVRLRVWPPSQVGLIK